MPDRVQLRKRSPVFSLRETFANLCDWIRSEGIWWGASATFHVAILSATLLAMGTFGASRMNDKAPQFEAIVNTIIPEESVVEHFKLDNSAPDASDLPVDSLDLDKDVPTIDSNMLLSAANTDAFETASVSGPLTDSPLGGLGGLDVKAFGPGAKITGSGGLGMGGGGGGGQSTLFGMRGGSRGGRGGGGGGNGLVGHFFDLKQGPDRNKLPYSSSFGETFKEYIKTINRLIAAGLTESATRAYYQANTPMLFGQLLISPGTSANDAPKAFGVEKEVEPRGWFVHYSGTVIPPQKGEWRFVGFFDDMLLIYINNQPVLDGSWVPMCNVGNGSYDNELRQKFGGPEVSPSHHTAFFGKWVTITGPVKIDILIGETPGGHVGGLLMCQRRGTNYQLREDGTPILPLFATSNAASQRISQDSFAQEYQLVPNPPLWTPVAKKWKK